MIDDNILIDVENLNKLSLLAFITIQNTFNGLYMTEYLRIWILNVDIRLTPRLTFDLKDKDLDKIIREALERVITYYKENHQEFLEDKQ